MCMGVRGWAAVLAACFCCLLRKELVDSISWRLAACGDLCVGRNLYRCFAEVATGQVMIAVLARVERRRFCLGMSLWVALLGDEHAKQHDDRTLDKAV